MHWHVDDRRNRLCYHRKGLRWLDHTEYGHRYICAWKRTSDIALVYTSARKAKHAATNAARQSESNIHLSTGSWSTRTFAMAAAELPDQGPGVCYPAVYGDPQLTSVASARCTVVFIANRSSCEVRNTKLGRIYIDGHCTAPYWFTILEAYP